MSNQDSFPAGDRLRSLSLSELKEICSDVKKFLRKKSTEKEGHILSSLAVTELTVALHYVLNTPRDILIWDVGHQAYIHKIITDRADRFHTNRKKGGLSGFTKRSESVYDPFGAGHSSTSVSALAGFALADALTGETRKKVAVIGDGALTGGMSFEALNFAGERQLDILVVLNDNRSSIDENTGALARQESYEQYFRAMGFRYYEEPEGQDVEKLVNRLEELTKESGPRVVRVITRKDVKNGQAPESTSFQSVFADEALQLARNNGKLIFITPAMLSGSGLNKVQAAFPERVIDVGIAEQNAVTLAAGVSAAGLRPLVHLYSTFAQRAYDQIIHDVALQNLPVIFCLDRAGIAGADGPTHHGCFDPGFLNTIPGVVISAPVNGHDLRELLQMGESHQSPFFIRYPKSACTDLAVYPSIRFGEMRCLKPGREKAILSFGNIAENAGEALKDTTYAHFNFPFLKPFDREGLHKITGAFGSILTVEENSPRGGFGDTVRAHLSGKRVRIESLSLPDAFIEHGSRTELLIQAGLDPESIREAIDLL